MENNNEQDAIIWEIAKKRVKFKEQLGSYIAVNGVLWLLWLFTYDSEVNEGLPWPAWCTIGWGIGLIFKYAKAYKTPTNLNIEKEVEKIKRNS